MLRVGCITFSPRISGVTSMLQRHAVECYFRYIILGIYLFLLVTRRSTSTRSVSLPFTVLSVQFVKDKIQLK